MGRGYVERAYPMPEGVYEDMRDLAEEKGIAVSRVMDTAFDWWLSKVSGEKGFFASFVAKLPRYAKAYKGSRKERVPVKLKVGNATLLDIFSKNLNVNKAALMYAIFKEYFTHSVEESNLGPGTKPEPAPIKEDQGLEDILERLKKLKPGAGWP